MASGKDRIKLDIDVTTQEAEQNIKQFSSELENLDKLINHINDKTIDISGADIDKYLSNLQKIYRLGGSTSAKMKKDITRGDARTSADTKPSPTQLKKGFNQFNKEFDNAIKDAVQTVQNFSSKSAKQSRMVTSRTKMTGGPSWGDRPFPGGADLETRQTQRDKQKVTSRVTSSVSGLERAGDTGALTYSQNKILKGQMDDVYFGATGAGPDDKDKVLSYAKGETDGKVTWDADEESPLGRARSRITGSSDEIQELEDQLVGIRAKKQEYNDEGSTAYSEEKMAEMVEAESKTLDEIKKQQKLREENQNLLTEIVDGIRRVEKARGEFDEKTNHEGISVAPEQGTAKSAIASRANALALSAATSALFTLTSSMKEGKAIVDSQRQASMQIGLGTGNYDFREIREEARGSGEEYAYGGNDMLSFGQSVMGSMGYSDENDGVTQQLARSERLIGADEGTMSNLFESSLRSGAVGNESEAKDLVELISGGIIASGMVGREEEAVTTMEAILNEQGKGRKVSNEESKRTISLLSSLSGMGNEAMQGDNLAQNFGSLQEGLANTDVFGTTAMHLKAQNPEKYSGIGGQHQIDKALEEGLSNEDLVSAVGDELLTMTNSREEALDKMRHLDATSGLTTEGREVFYDALESGRLEDAVDAGTAEQYQKDGASKLDKSEEGFQESGDYTRLQRDADRDQAQGYYDDSFIGDISEGISAIFWKVSASSPIAALGGTLVKAIMSGVVTSGIGSMALKFLRPMFTGIGSTISTGLGLGTAATSTAAGLGTAATGTAAATGTGLLAKASGAISTGISSLTQGGSESALKGGLMTKAVIDTAMGAYKVSQADNKSAEAVSQAGDVAGGLGGAWAGGKAGALAGSAFGPWGSLIGGAIGGIGGGIAGSGIGKGISDWAAGKWFGGTDEQNAELEAEMETEDSELAAAETQGDVALTSEKSSVEGRRSDNIAAETENLSAWDILVKDIRELLEIARKQNGIMGNAPGSSSFAGGTGVGGELGAVGEDGYWTSKNIKDHDVTKTSSELTSGQLDEWIAAKAPKDSEMSGMGSAFMDAGNQHGIDPRVLVGIAGHESAWGTSKQAKEKKNFFGMNANTNSPGDAFSYESGEKSIMNAADTLRRLYIEEGRTTLKDIGPKYAADKGWADKVASHTKGSEEYTSKSKGDINITTTVNMKDTAGSSRAGARSIGNEVANSIKKKIPPAFRWDEKLKM